MGTRRPFRLTRAGAGPQPPADELWVDLSNRNGPLTDAMCDDMLAAGVDGVIIQAITGLDGISYTRQQLNLALARGLRIAGYVWCFQATSVASRLSMFDGYALEFLALDNEDRLTIAAVDRDLSLCDAYIALLTEFYSAPWVFEQNGWGQVTRWSNRRLWYAIYDDNPDPNADFVPFGGWSECWTKQFWDRQVYGGVVCDVNFRRVA